MRAVVIYESMFGNTRRVAEAVAAGLSARLGADRVSVLEAGAAAAADRAPVEGVDLVVVGGPTHAFGLSRPSTRRSAADVDRDAAVPTGAGLREWLAAASPGAGRLAAAFATRVRRPLVAGSAAKAATRRLRRLGYRLVDRPRDFWVAGTPGPLNPGELERAVRWGEDLATRAARQAGVAL
jgi:hypothetical protein